MEAKKAPNAEHGEEAEQHGGWGHAGNVKSEVDGSKQAAEDVIEDQSEQQESAPCEETDAKHQIGYMQSVPTSA
jgi:hypothetical protein